MVACIWVVLVLYRREFRSITLRALIEPDGDGPRDETAGDEIPKDDIPKDDIPKDDIPKDDIPKDG